MPATACIPSCPAAPGRPVRYELEYKRKGFLALLAGLDVHTGQVFASTPATTGIKPFMDLAGQVMARPGYKNAPRVSSSWTTARTTAARPPSAGWPKRTRTRS
jgi:hypothetical protein